MKNHYRPMLAKTAEAPFSSNDWIFEVKWDGIRAISYIDDELSIRSRNDKELTDSFPELQELQELARNVVLDGEIVVIKDGKADFQTLIERSRNAPMRDVEYVAARNPATYVVFDILEKDGKVLINLPLLERKRILKDSVKEGKHVALSLYVEEEGEAYYKAALERGVEGIVAKKKDSPYQPGYRSSNWLKIKKVLSCDCVIFGYTKGEGSRAETFGALILGLYDINDPVYVGKVGTGFSEKDLELLLKTFQRLKVEHETLKNVDVPEEITWLNPELVAEVIYQAVTKDEKLRAPRFNGLRPDKAPHECTMDQLKHSNLQEYVSKRDFTRSPEPVGLKSRREGNMFVIQEHDARRLHFDLRLERMDVLKSWAVPKGLPSEAGEKRLAVETEDHPLEYGSFEGTIPKGQYGAGTVKIWDKGSYQLKTWENDKIEFTLNGQRLQGRYVLARFKKAGGKEWLLLKVRD
jgi:DNA ligase D-like protein (predicted ligase)/DNA ligase D-like protein (predicted 3'-phosphoesterase)